jgi:hypothetical protein
VRYTPSEAHTYEAHANEVHAHEVYVHDECIHLVSGVQLAGFRHVVGKQWEVSD